MIGFGYKLSERYINIVEIMHRRPILITVPERYDTGSWGPIIVIFVEYVLIILFIPWAPVSSSQDWSMNFNRECPDKALSFTSGCEDICERNHIAHEPKWCF